MKSITYNILDIVAGTAVDGPGLRTSIYFAGCIHHCEGCHNPQSWAPNSGSNYSLEELLAIIDENDFNVTFTGGDPLFQIDTLIDLAKHIKRSGRNIWCYTGYRFEDIFNKEPYVQLLSYIDVLVDGRFEMDKRDISLQFRGSANQRLIDVKSSLDCNEIVLWQQSIL